VYSFIVLAAGLLVPLQAISPLPDEEAPHGIPQRQQQQLESVVGLSLRPPLCSGRAHCGDVRLGNSWAD